jgi:hypothetical protein
MKISYIAWSRKKDILCIGCGIRNTSWRDGVCSICTENAPNHIPYSQHRQWYNLKKRKEYDLHKQNLDVQDS